MFFKRLLNSQSGMSLAEMAIATGLLGVAALGAASMAGNLGDQAKRAEGLVARTQLTSALNTYLYSTMGCEDLKSAAPGGVFSDSQPTPIELKNWGYQGLASIKGGHDNNGKKLTQVRYIDIDTLEGQLDPLAGAQAVNGLKKSTLNIRLMLKIGSRDFKHLYAVPVLVEDSGKLVFCSDEKTIAETCASMRGIYNPDTKQCDLAEGCQIRGTYAVLTCSGGQCDSKLGTTERNQYTNGESCPQGSSAVLSHSTSWTHRQNCGKKCTNTVTNNKQWFTCLACPAGAGVNP